MNTEAQTPVDAATIVLLRDGKDGLETYMTVRASTMAFQPNALVFPGGKVSSGDLALLRGDPLGRFKIAAIRETFEEVGVLLAKRDDQPLIAQEVTALFAWRNKLAEHSTHIEKVAASSGISLDVDALHLIARWVTPRAMPKRFDTYFFLAEMPENQLPEPDGNEVVSAHWFTPRQALAAGARGECLLLPPTFWTLKDLEIYSSADEAIAAMGRESVDPIEPIVARKDGKIIIQVPDRDNN